jgi:beta-lactamase superfamily II metal-dependent hydrolase
MRTILRLLLAFGVTLTASADTLPPWTRGTLDIHQISTGRGNAAFFVFPDGTTMLVDAGAAGDGIEYTDQRPNKTRTPGGWIVRYIERMMVPQAARIDYAVVTHFHVDHMGGITEVGGAIPIGKLIDRGMDYLPPPATDAMIKNYLAFVANRGVKRETIRVGAADQITLRDRNAFKTFEIRNVAANGQVWNGEGGSKSIFPPLASIGKEDLPSENMCSIGLRIRYGKFDYWTGGDIPGVPDPGYPDWQSVETAVARAIGPTDVHVVNHHGSISPESAFFLATLKSAVMILPAWSPTHPSQDVLKRMMTMRLYPGPHDIFVTTLREPTKASIGPRVSQLKATHGHIVVRVAPGGDHYQVFVLDDTSEEMNVIGTFGPYVSQ